MLPPRVHPRGRAAAKRGWALQNLSVGFRRAHRKRPVRRERGKRHRRARSPRGRQRPQGGRPSSLNRRVPCSRSPRRDPKCRRPLHHWLCRHGPEAAGWGLRSAGRVPHGCPMRHERRASDHRHAHGAHRKAPSQRHQCACRPYPHIRQQCRRRWQYSGLPARGPLPDRAFAILR